MYTCDGALPAGQVHNAGFVAEKTWWAFGISTKESMGYVREQLVRVFFELERVFVALQVPILLPTFETLHAGRSRC